MKDRPYIQLYNTMILQTRRGTSRNGGVINAKPIFVLALIEVIRRGVFSNNLNSAKRIAQKNSKPLIKKPLQGLAYVCDFT